MPLLRRPTKFLVRDDRAASRVHPLTFSPPSSALMRLALSREKMSGLLAISELEGLISSLCGTLFSRRHEAVMHKWFRR
jgi:hypothetical protein